MTKQEARRLAIIEQIVRSNGAVPEGVSPDEFAEEILPLLGTPEGALREQRVLGILYTWIVRRTLSDDGLHALLDTVTDEQHLFLEIGEAGTETIYMRSFCAFLASAFVRAHRGAAYLSASRLEALVESMVRYLDEEQDLRGYVSQETWWAHAVAHAADTFGELAQCTELGAAPLRRMLDAMGRKTTTGRLVYANEEDTRIAAAAIHALHRGVIPETEAKEWIFSLVPAARFAGVLPGVHFRYVNARNVLRCLIYQGEQGGLSPQHLRWVVEAHAALPER